MGQNVITVENREYFELMIMKTLYVKICGTQLKPHLEEIYKMDILERKKKINEWKK